MKKFGLLISVAILLALLIVPRISGKAASSITQPATGTLPATSATLTPSPANTQPLPSNEPTEAPEQSGPKPTRTPRPTGTPIPVPPPSDPDTNSMLIGLGVIAALVVFFGVWVNRSVRL